MGGAAGQKLRIGSKNVHRQFQQLLIGASPDKLERRADRSGVVGRLQMRAHPQIVEALSFNGSIEARQLPANNRIFAERTAVAAHSPGQLDDVVQGLFDARVQQGRDVDPFVHQRCNGHGPPVLLLPQHVLSGHPNVSKENLVELGVAGHLSQGLDLDAGRLHIDDQVGQPLVLWRLRIAPRQK